MGQETSIAQYAFFLLIVATLVKPLGIYMSAVFQGKPTKLDVVLVPIEKSMHRLIGIQRGETMDWKQYAYAFVFTTMTAALFVYAVLRLQELLPWFYPQYMNTPLTADLAMNTAVSFVTTSTWQAYGGENTMSYVSQMLALVTGSFLGGAAGLSVGIAFIRGFANDEEKHLGNFYIDLIRALLWVLLPASFFGCLFLIWQGVPMNFHPYTEAVGLEGHAQTIAQGPVAALELIKNLGTNGGGFFNVNGAHPYANPSPLSNLFGMLSIAVLPAALTYTFGAMTGRIREGWTLFIVMVILFVAGLSLCDLAEHAGNPNMSRAALLSSDENLEGKEVRFGVSASVLTAVVTSNTSCGSYNSMHDSFTPLGGIIPLINMCIGQFIFGGLGSGIWGIILWALVTMFLVGLMVGRTPEYLGQKIGPKEMKLITLYTLASPMIILLLSAIALMTKEGLAGLTTNTGPHGFVEIMYAYASASANNGQNFAGLSANSPFYNVTTAIAMMVGRFALAIPVLALAEKFSLQPTRATSQGSIPTDTPTFALVMIATIVIVGALSYMPALVLGPLLENSLMLKGKLF